MRRIRDDLYRARLQRRRGRLPVRCFPTSCAGSCLLPNGTRARRRPRTAPLRGQQPGRASLLDSPSVSTGRDFSGTFPTYRLVLLPLRLRYMAGQQKLTVAIGLRLGIVSARRAGLPPASFPTSFRRATRWWSRVGRATQHGGLVNHLNYLAPALGSGVPLDGEDGYPDGYRRQLYAV